MAWRKRLSNSLRGTLQEKIFYLHIPKCGGTSIRHAMADCYTTLRRGQDRGIIRIDAFATKKARNILIAEQGERLENLITAEQALLYYMSGRRVRFISGHVPFYDIAYRNFDFAFVTILRDPVERWLSEYTFNRFHHKKDNKLAAEVANYDMEIDEYLESPRGQAQGAQYSLFLGGYNEAHEYRSRESVQRAIRNLQRCAVVGTLEDLSGFVEHFRARFGSQLDIGHSNPNPRPKAWAKARVTERVRTQIENICEPDLEIYQQAQQDLESPG